jgi:hypothetical protein
MASLVKEIKYRVKGTEVFWNNPEGAEAILQVRAAALSEDERPARHVQTRPGCPFHSPPQITQAHKAKSQKPTCTLSLQEIHLLT